jgi:hypothetical protein
LIGATYQMISFGLAYVWFNQYNYNYTTRMYFNISAFLIEFWAISHLLNAREVQRVVWPAIIVALGAGTLGNLIISWATPNVFPILGDPTIMVSANVAATLLPAPILLILGGISGLIAARRSQQ